MPIDARNPLSPCHTTSPLTHRARSQRRVLVLEVPIPGDGHEDVGDGQQENSVHEIDSLFVDQASTSAVSYWMNLRHFLWNFWTPAIVR